MNQYGPGLGPSLIFRGLHHTLVPLDSTYGFQGPQQKCMLWIWTQTSLSNYLYIVHVVETIALHGALKHIYIKCLWVLLTRAYPELGRPYMCGCGRPSNLVLKWTSVINCILWPILALNTYIVRNIWSFSIFFMNLTLGGMGIFWHKNIYETHTGGILSNIIIISFKITFLAQLSLLHIHNCFQQHIISSIVPIWLEIEV